MNKLFALMMGIIAASVSALAQQTTISGTIKNEQGQPLEMANVIAMNAADSSMAAFAFSNSSGVFEMRVQDRKSYLVRISYMGYETFEQVVAVPEGQKVTLNPSLKEKPEFLQEAHVVEDMPVVISGDTISYKAEAFNKGTEKKLEDVLENLPGIEVEDDGQVTVEGKTVEKVLVDGKEFFDGDTKIATQNIPANAVEKVQVLRNYNDVSPLGGVTNNEDRVAINITLKEGKKSMVFGDVEAATGPDSRYLAHPNIFYYNPKFSINFIGDANNVGQPAFTMRDYFRFTGGMRGLNARMGSNLNVGSDIGIPIGSNDRNVEITSDFAATNISINPNKAWSINGFVIYMHNNTLKKTNSLNNYVGQDSLLSEEVAESEEVEDSKSVLGKLSVQYTPSTKVHLAYDGFVKYNQISSVQDQFSDFGATQRNIENTSDQTPIEFDQNIEAVWDINAKSIISFEGQHMYKKQDPLYNLVTDEKPSYTFIPTLDSGWYNLTQSRLITTNKFDGIFNYYYIVNKKNHIELSAGGSHSTQSLSSELWQTIEGQDNEFTDSGLVNDVTFKLADAYAGIHWKAKYGKLTIRPGLNAHYYQTNDLQWGNDLQRSWNMVLPDFFAKFDFKSSENITLNYAMKAGFTDVNNAAEGAILKGYNSLFVGNRYLDNAIYHSVDLRYFMFNMFNFTNIYAGLSYNKRINDITNQIKYVGVDVVSSPINSDAVNDVYSLYGGYHRRFGYYRVSVRGNVNYALTNNLVNGENNSNGSLSQSYRAQFATNFSNAPNVEVGYRLSLSNYIGNNLANDFYNHMPYIEFEWQFWTHFLFDARYEYNYYTSPNTGPSSVFDFLDANLRYFTGNEKWEFKIGATNILDTRIIRQDNFTNSVTTTQEIYVLPRYILFGAKYNL